MAVALLGFDGVLLAVLVSADATLPLSTAAAAAFLVASAGVAVAVVAPRNTHTFDTKTTITAWEELHTGSLDGEAQLFTEMLLAREPDLVDEQKPNGRVGKWRYERNAKRRQPLLSIEALASRRATILNISCYLMIPAFALLAWSLYLSVK